MKMWLKQHPTVSFLGITFAWSWALWLLLLATQDITSVDSYSAQTLGIIFAGAFGPTIGALVVTYMQSGWAGIRTLLGRLFVWRVGLRWYALLLLPFIMWLITVQLVGRLQGVAFEFTGSVLMVIPALLSSLLGGPIAEEIGWRGWLLPQLQQRYSLVRASVLVGIIWGAWHLPAFFLPGIALGESETGALIPIMRYFMVLIAMSIICGWVSSNTRRSLLIDMLLHAAFNASGTFIFLNMNPDAYGIFGPQLAWINMILWWLVAGLIIFFSHRRTFRIQSSPVVIEPTRQQFGV